MLNTVTQTFLFSYLVLFGLTIITFIEALKTSQPRLRHMLNLETSVSLIAGFVYSIFYDMLKKGNIELEQITVYRYMDWCITTPMLLLVLLTFLNFDNKRDIHMTVYIYIVILNYTMLISGYLGETGRMEKRRAGIVGFIAFAIMLAIIYFVFLHEAPFFLNNYILFCVFSIVWSMYGVAYYLDTVSKNIMYNFLDVIAKAIFGVFIWLYYGNVVVFP